MLSCKPNVITLSGFVSYWFGPSKSEEESSRSKVIRRTDVWSKSPASVPPISTFASTSKVGLTILFVTSFVDAPPVEGIAREQVVVERWCARTGSLVWSSEAWNIRVKFSGVQPYVLSPCFHQLKSMTKTIFTLVTSVCISEKYRWTSLSVVFLSANSLIHIWNIDKKGQISSQNVSFYLRIQFRGPK